MVLSRFFLMPDLFPRYGIGWDFGLLPCICVTTTYAAPKRNQDLTGVVKIPRLARTPKRCVSANCIMTYKYSIIRNVLIFFSIAG